MERLRIKNTDRKFIVGNVFSSLVGLSFDWSLLSDTDVEYGSIIDAHNVLRYIKSNLEVHIILNSW